MLSRLINFLRACWRPSSGSYGHAGSDAAGRQDGLLWYKDSGQHLIGEFSMAVVQANNLLEDQSQIESGSLSLLDSGPYGTFAGIYDGHGGPETSRYINDHLFQHLKTFAAEQKSMSVDVIEKAFQATEEGFFSLVAKQWSTKPQMAAVGSCYLVGVICDGTLYVANVGDSQAVLGRLVKATREVLAIQLSAEHNASVESVRQELHSMHPDDSQIVVLKHNVWCVKGLIQVEALAIKLTQNEGELIQEKFEVKKLVNFLKQASEDAKRLVNQERSFACAEIESARSVVQRIGEALDEEERNSPTSLKQKFMEVEVLLEEVQEARRIKLLHQPSKVMDMEHELRALRIQIREKSTVSFKLQKELAMSRRAGQNKSEFYELTGSETLGSNLKIQSCSAEAIDVSKCSVQWYRLSSECSRREPIVGADKFVYAPEPIDVGRLLEADIVSNGQKVSLTTTAPIDPASGLGSYVDTLLRKSNIEFSVVIAQMNGRNYSSRSAHCFHVGKTKLKLGKGWITKARDSYSGSMQLCGFRGGGNSAAKSLFWQPRKGHSFVLVFESEKERNGALMAARKYANDCNVILAGPDDDALI